MDNDKRGSQRGPKVTDDLVGDIGRNQKEEDPQRNTRQRSDGFLEEGVVTIKQDDQHVGYGVPEGAQFIKRQAISCDGANILRGGSDVLEWIDRT